MFIKYHVNPSTLNIIIKRLHGQKQKGRTIQRLKENRKSMFTFIFFLLHSLILRYIHVTLLFVKLISSKLEKVFQIVLRYQLLPIWKFFSHMLDVHSIVLLLLLLSVCSCYLSSVPQSR